MIDLTRLMEIQIMNREIIDARRVNSGIDLIGRLNADNAGGQHDVIIAYLQVALDPLKIIIDQAELDATRRSSKTMITDEDMASVKLEGHHAFKMVDLAVGAGSAIGIEIFRHGLATVNDMNKTIFSPVISAIIARLSAHEATFPGESAILNNMKITYTTDRNLQIGDKSNVSVDSEAQQAASLEYCKKFSDAICDLSKLHRDTPGKAASYFNQSLLLPFVFHTHDHHAGTGLPFGTKIMIKHREFAEKTTFTVSSLTTGVTLSACIVVVETDAFGNKLVVSGGKSRKGKSWAYGGEDGTYLMLENESLDTNGDWDIDIID